MDKVFELYDDITGQHIGFFNTLPGAMEAMSSTLDKLAPALCRDYEDDKTVEFSLKYTIKTHQVGK